MAITKVKVANFKGFRDLEIEFGAFNVLIGANAAGKSNVVQVFQFLKDLVRHGLDNAISMQGGGEFFRNVSMGARKDFVLEVTTNAQIKGEVFDDTLGFAEFEAFEAVYKIFIEFEQRGENVGHFQEQFILTCTLKTRRYRGALESERKVPKSRSESRTGRLIFTNTAEVVSAQFVGDDSEVLNLETRAFRSDEFKDYRLSPGAILSGASPFMPLFMNPNPSAYFGDIGIYDLDPRLPKRAVQIAGKADLEGDGSNLAIVLKNILESKEQRRKFTNLVRDVLPFVRDLRIEKFADKSLFFELREHFHERKYLPASLLSDGTINVTALIIALYFEQNAMTIIEEPERNIHPALIARVVDMMKEVAQERQVLVTTHNPEIVKYATLDSLLLVARDDEGFSTVVKPAEKDTVQSFLEADLGVEELFVRNLLAL